MIEGNKIIDYYQSFRYGPEQFCITVFIILYISYYIHTQMAGNNSTSLVSIYHRGCPSKLANCSNESYLLYNTTRGDYVTDFKQGKKYHIRSESHSRGANDSKYINYIIRDLYMFIHD